MTDIDMISQYRPYPILNHILGVHLRVLSNDVTMIPELLKRQISKIVLHMFPMIGLTFETRVSKPTIGSRIFEKGINLVVPVAYASDIVSIFSVWPRATRHADLTSEIWLSLWLWFVMSQDPKVFHIFLNRFEDD